MSNGTLVDTTISGAGAGGGGKSGVVALIAKGEEPSTPYASGSKWYYDGKIYTALTTTTKDSGVTPSTDISYLYDGVYYSWNGSNLVADDQTNLVHKSEEETITGPKTFSGALKANTMPKGDISKNVATTEFVYDHSLQSHEELGVTFDLVTSAGTRKLAAASLSCVPGTDLVEATDDFAEHEAFKGYYAVCRYNETSQKMEVYAIQDTLEYDDCFELGTDNKKHLKPGNYLFRFFHIFWYKSTIDANGKPTVIISAEDKTSAGYKVSPMHNRNGVLHEWWPISVYAMGESSEEADGGFALRDDLCPLTYKTIVEFENLARTRGCRVFGYKEMLSLQLLGLVKYASLDWQSFVGKGNTGGWSDSLLCQTDETDSNFIIVKKSEWTGANQSSVPDTMKCIAIGASGATAVWYKVVSSEDYTIENDATAYTKVVIDGTVSTTAGTTKWMRGMQTTGNIEDVLGLDGENTGNGTIASDRRPNKNMGLMHLYGNCGTFEGGIAGVGDGTNEKIYINPDPDGTVDYSKATITANWIDVGGTVPSASVNNGLFNASADLNADIFLFKGDAGSGKTNDQQYFAHANNTVYRGFYGGPCTSGAAAGGFYVGLHNAVSNSSRAVGCRLVFVP